MKLTTTPEFVIHECERMIEALPTDCKKYGEEILKRLNQDNTLEEAILLMDEMMQFDGYLEAQELLGLFKRSCVSQDLLETLSRIDTDDAKHMLGSVKSMANFESCWCQDDECYGNYNRTFELVNSEEEWEQICSRGEILPSNAVKIAMLVEKPKKDEEAEKHWQEAAHNLCEMEHAELYSDIWFGTTQKVIYYIYP